MRGTKVIDENLEELQVELQGMIGRATTAHRDLNNVESARVSAIEIAANRLKSERAETADRMRGIVAMSRTPSFYSPTAHNDDRKPSRVLPVNGVFEDEPQYRHYNRVAKLKAFKGPDADRRAYDAGMWLRAVVAREFNRGEDCAAVDHCARVGLQITNVGTEGVGTGGGYVVPSPLSSVIIDVREEVGVTRRAVNIQPMSSDTLSFPKHTSGLTVYYPGEAQALTLSDVGWGQIQLLAKKRAVAHQMSQELVDDSIINIVDYIFREMAYALADREDAEFINGDGTSTYGLTTGLKSAIGAGGISTAATGHDTWGELDLTDFTNMMALLPDRFHAGSPAFVCSSSFYFSVMLRIHAAAGGNTIASLQGGDGGTRQFLGYPVHTTQYMPTTTAVATVCCFFGSFWMGAILGERIGVRVARSDDYAFLNDVTTLKATTRYDFNIHEPGTASLAGAYVGLKTAS